MRPEDDRSRSHRIEVWSPGKSSRCPACGGHGFDRDGMECDSCWNTGRICRCGGWGRRPLSDDRGRLAIVGRPGEACQAIVCSDCRAIVGVIVDAATLESYEDYPADTPVISRG